MSATRVNGSILFPETINLLRQVTHNDAFGKTVRIRMNRCTFIFSKTAQDFIPQTILYAVYSAVVDIIIIIIIIISNGLQSLL